MQDIERLKGAPNLRVTEGPENRSIFLGFDVGSPELASSDVKGKNPFADVRVRQAVNMAINRQAIQRVVMRGQAVVAGSIVGPFVNGYKKEYDSVPPTDVAKAKALLAAAGYPNGFSVSLHCPNDRYLNDEAICQAAVGMLGQVGIKINLVSQSKSLHFPALQNLKSDFFLLGWGVPTYDSDYIFSYPLPHARGRARRLELDALFQPGGRQADPEPVDRNRQGQARRDHHGDLGQAARRPGLRGDPSPDAGARDEGRHRCAGAHRQHHLLQARRVQEIVMRRRRARHPSASAELAATGISVRFAAGDAMLCSTVHDRVHSAQPRPGRRGDAGGRVDRVLDVPLRRRSGRQHGRPGSLAGGARRAHRAARPQRPLPDPVRAVSSATWRAASSACRTARAGR